MSMMSSPPFSSVFCYLFHIPSAAVALGNALFFIYVLDFCLFTFIQIVSSTLQFSLPHFCLRMSYPPQQPTLSCTFSCSDQMNNEVNVSVPFFTQRQLSFIYTTTALPLAFYYFFLDTYLPAVACSLLVVGSPLFSC